jgi:Uncharacterized protein conserved in bacteria
MVVGEIIMQKGKGDSQERNSSIELLRIFLMLMIIAGHYSAHGNYGQFTIDTLSWRIFILQILPFGGRIANNAFILITGYYLISLKINYKRVFYLLLEMFFYSWLAVAVMFFFEKEITMSLIKECIKACLPMFFGNSFSVGYFILCLIIPSLNNMLNGMKKEQFRKMIIIILLIWSIIPTITLGIWEDNFGKISGFIIMYVLGAYIRLYGFDMAIMKIPKPIWLVGAILALPLLVLLMDVLSIVKKYDAFMNSISFFCGEFSIFCVFIAVTMFTVFKEKNFYNKWINYVAEAVFGIYLFHNNGIFLTLFFQRWYPNKDFIDSKWFLIHLLFKVISIFVIGVIIDKTRKFIFEKPVKIGMETVQKFFIR